MRWPYPNIGVLTTRAFRNLLNKIFGDIGADMQEQKNRVDNLINGTEQPSEVVDMHLGRDGQTYPVARDMVIGEIEKTESAQAQINEDTAAQLADETQNRQNADDDLQQNLSIKELKNRLYRKKVFRQLNLKFPDYSTIIASDGIQYLYPQSFTIDWQAQQIFVQFTPNFVSLNQKQYVVVYDLETGEYISCFHAGDIVAEGIVIKYENGSRYCYVKTTGGLIGKFDVTSLPANLSSPSPVATYDVGLYVNFDYRNGRWLVEQSWPALATSHRRTNFMIYDDDFNKIGSINISTSDGGFREGSYVDYIPKRQGIALGDGFMVQATGGFHGQGDPIKAYSYQGLKILQSSGALLEEGLVDPEKLIDALIDAGYESDRVEYEGIHVSPEGEIYSLLVNKNPELIPDEGGILIFHECADDVDAMDLSDIGRTYVGFDPVYLSTGIFPRGGDGQMHNPLTGDILDTMDKILDFMVNTDLKLLSFYTTSVTVGDIGGQSIPDSILVKISNANSATFFVDWFNVDGYKKFIIYPDSNGNRIKQQIGFNDQNLKHFGGSYQAIKSITKIFREKTGIQVKLLGDSITAGYAGSGYDVSSGEVIPTTDGQTYHVNQNGHCWANSLRDYLQSKFSCTVKNWGISGITSQFLLGNLSTLVEDNDDIVIVMIGTNDRQTQYGITKDQLYNNLVTIGDYIHGKGTEVIFMSANPAAFSDENSSTKPKSYNMEDVDYCVMAAAAHFNMEYISLYKLVMHYCENKSITLDSLLSDGLHPTDDGYDLLFRMICDALGIGRSVASGTGNFVDWTAVTLLNGAQQYSATVPSYRVVPLTYGRRLVEINMAVKNITSANTFGSIPAQYAPKYPIPLSMPSTQSNGIRWEIQIDGTIKVINFGGITPAATDYFPLRTIYTL